MRVKYVYLCAPYYLTLERNSSASRFSTMKFKFLTVLFFPSINAINMPFNNISVFWNEIKISNA